MGRAFHALVAGTIFGAGLAVSGMVNPQKILNFLDFASVGSRNWDPTLAFVFLGALTVSFTGVRIRAQLSKPLAARQFHEPQAGAQVDLRLLAGAALFGLGWGVTGLCPGPALSAVTLAGSQLASLLLFLAAMVIGMRAADALPRG
ncbi:MAG: DUF6691 family protein [Pseudomonadota bacterium]